jgi:tetratricopeptide (TPR) repeat protein
MNRLLLPSALVLLAFASANAQRNLGSTQPGPINLSGKIMMKDESPLPDGVNILIVCNGRPRTTTFTDRKGAFSFQSGQIDSLTLPDIADGLPTRNVAGPVDGPMTPPSSGSSASVPAGRAGLSLLGCELRADLPGYSSSSIKLDGHLPSDSPAVGTIVLSRLSNVEGVSVSATSLKAPADARKAYERGLDSLHKGKIADAEKDFEKAVAIYPQYANAWLDLGKARLQNKQLEPAGTAFQKTIEADDKMVEAHAQLGMLQAQQGQWAEAAKQLDTALSLDPVDFPKAWFMDAVANFNIKNYDAAAKSAREAVKIDSAHANPEADRLLGLILATKGDYPGALEELAIYLKFAPEGPPAEQVKKQVAQIQALQTQPNH